MLTFFGAQLGNLGCENQSKGLLATAHWTCGGRLYGEERANIESKLVNVG
jgi:hypothetical protein